MSTKARKENAPSPVNSSESNDEEFSVTAEMMIDGEDYENTLDEEEELEDEDDDELTDLQKEGEMPLEELLQMYYGSTGSKHPNSDLELNEDSSHREPASPENKRQDESSQSSGEGTSATAENGDDQFLNQRVTRGLAALNSHYFDEDYSSDEDYQPSADEWKKEIQIGEEHQADVPVGLCHYKVNEKTCDTEDKLLWTPDIVTSEQLHKYLGTVYKLQDIGSQTAERDDEQALFTLLQMRHVEMALAKRQEQEKAPPEISLWYEDECQNFEQGLRVFGKDFRLIQKNKVQSRSIGEIVEFYYLWKKTERHDAFVTQTKLGRRKYTLPGIADMMGRFIEECDTMFSSEPSSPDHFSNNTHPDNMTTRSDENDVTLSAQVSSEISNIKQENNYAHYENRANETYYERNGYDRSIKQNTSNEASSSWRRTSPNRISIGSVN